MKLMMCTPSPKYVWVFKSRRMRWAVHVVRIDERQAYTGFWWGNLRERGNLKVPGIDERIILTNLCLTFYYWNGSDVGVIYILLRKVVAESDFSPMSAS